VRTTIDLPDQTFRAAKAKAAMLGMSLKDLITHYIDIGLGGPEPDLGRRGRRSPLPIVETGPRALPSLSNAELYALLDEDTAAGTVSEPGPESPGR
jgi:hypothetical protein